MIDYNYLLRKTKWWGWVSSSDLGCDYFLNLNWLMEIIYHFWKEILSIPWLAIFIFPIKVPCQMSNLKYFDTQKYLLPLLIKSRFGNLYISCTFRKMITWNWRVWFRYKSCIVLNEDIIFPHRKRNKQIVFVSVEKFDINRFEQTK